MVIGHIPVSKTVQNQDLQFDTQRKAGCKKIYHEKISGASTERPEYEDDFGASKRRRHSSLEN